MPMSIRKAPKSVRPFDRTTFLVTMGQGQVIADYPKKEIIFAQGDDADAVFYIERGKVKVTVTKAGKQAVVAILGDGEFLGEGCLTGQPKRLATATATTDCVVVRLSKSEIARKMRGEPDFSHMFILHLLAKSARIQEDLVAKLFNTTEMRLARVLLLLANFGKEGRPEPIFPEVKQKALAEMVGTTRARVKLLMNKFQDLGFIDYNGKLEVHSSLLSVVLKDPQSHARTSMCRV
jgi:CRP/FNR family transcriptional regulator, cyclic AMP receptor protein